MRRFELELLASKDFLPFDYNYQLFSSLHSWLGNGNEWHGKRGLFTFSGLDGLKKHGNALVCAREIVTWHVGTADEVFAEALIEGLKSDKTVAFGLKVKELYELNPPQFKAIETFKVISPVFLKEISDGKTEGVNKPKTNHVVYTDAKASDTLTNRCNSKLTALGLPHVQASFAPAGSARTKLVSVKVVKMRTSVCPVRLVGSPDSIHALWCTGVGDSCGLGFGMLA